MSDTGPSARCFEPWTASQSRTWTHAFKFKPDEGADPETIERYNAARLRAEERAEWLVWGSDMLEPQVVSRPLGGVASSGSAAILARVGPPVTDREGGPDQAEIATRIARCVNACTGITDPVRTLDTVRELLLDLAAGRSDTGDARITHCLAHLGPTTGDGGRGRPARVARPGPEEG
jgi:hypothetical protein